MMDKADSRDEVYYEIPVTVHCMAHVTQSQIDEHRREFGCKVTPRQFVSQSYSHGDVGSDNISVGVTDYHWAEMGVYGPQRKSPVQTKLIAGR